VAQAQRSAHVRALLHGAVLATRKAASAEARLRSFDGGRRIVERERSRWLRHFAWVESPRHARRSLSPANGGVYIDGLMWRYGGDCDEILLEDARENELSAREGSQVLDSYPVGSGANREQISQKSTATRLACSLASTCDGRPVHRTSGSRAARSSLGGARGVENARRPALPDRTRAPWVLKISREAVNRAEPYACATLIPRTRAMATDTHCRQAQRLSSSGYEARVRVASQTARPPNELRLSPILRSSYPESYM
jgi:hypothetical protein